MRLSIGSRLTKAVLAALSVLALLPLTASAEGQWVMIGHRVESGPLAQSFGAPSDPHSVLMGRQVRWQDGSNIDLVLPSKASGALDELAVAGIKRRVCLFAALAKIGVRRASDPPRSSLE